MVISTAALSGQFTVVVVKVLVFPRTLIVTMQLSAQVMAGLVIVLPLPYTLKITVQLPLPLIEPPLHVFEAPESIILI